MIMTTVNDIRLELIEMYQNQQLSPDGNVEQACYLSQKSNVNQAKGNQELADHYERKMDACDEVWELVNTKLKKARDEEAAMVKFKQLFKEEKSKEFSELVSGWKWQTISRCEPKIWGKAEYIECKVTGICIAFIYTFKNGTTEWYVREDLSAA